MIRDWRVAQPYRALDEGNSGRPDLQNAAAHSEIFRERAGCPYHPS